MSTKLPDYEVLVKTGDVKGAGTDSNVYIALIDDHGRKSRDILLDCNWRDDFEKGNTDTFKIRNVPKLGPIEKIELWRDNKGLNDDWYVEWVKVRSLRRQAPPSNNNKTSKLDEGQKHPLKPLTEKMNNYVPFPCHRWIKEKRRFVILKYDSVLPQFDERKLQRKEELEEKRKKFEFCEKAEGLPRQVCFTFFFICYFM